MLTLLVCSYSEEFIFKKGVNNKSVWDLVASGDLDEAGRELHGAVLFTSILAFYIL